MLLFYYVGKGKGKTFFLSFIQPALLSMKGLLSEAGNGNYPILTGTVEKCLEMVECLHNEK